MQPIIFLALFSGIAVTAGVFMSVYFFLIRNEKDISFNLLGALFLAVSLRIAKSIFYYLTGIPEIGVAIGFIGLASIGPLVWMYINRFGKTNIEFSPTGYFHFALPVIGFFAVWLGGGNVPTWMYLFSTFVLFIYLSISWFNFLKIENQEPKIKVWNQLILISVSLIWGAFVYQHFSDTMIDYAAGAALASLLIYVLLGFALKNPILFPKTSRVNIDPIVTSKLRQAIEEEKIYQRPALTLSNLAEELNEPTYILSKALKAEYGKPFPELINHYRIRDVKNKLSNSVGEFVKIEGLAYEVGFNTPSAFYAAFKKETSLSPKEFQKKVAQ